MTPAYTLPSGKFPLDAHFVVLRRFMSLSRNGTEPVTAASVEGQGIPAGAAELNVAFLSGMGLLIEEKHGEFKPTPVAMQLVNTQLADESRGRRLLRSLIEKNWFGTIARKLPRSNPTATIPREEIAAALAAAAQVSVDEEASAIGVLIEYLVYTRILVLADRETPSGTERVGLIGVTRQNTGREVESPRAKGRTEPAGRDQIPSTTKSADWEEIQTNEFSLRIRPHPAAVKRLRKQLDLLEQKLAEQT
ncbi:MAG: hypothetical protein WCB19_06770 [Thermoplasmata archaeon]